MNIIEEIWLQASKIDRFHGEIKGVMGELWQSLSGTYGDGKMVKRRNKNGTRRILERSLAYDVKSSRILLADLQLCKSFILRQMGCKENGLDRLSFVSYSILVNAEAVGSFPPRRGLRQGDPMSQYASLGERVTLINSVLDSIPSCFQSQFGFEVYRFDLLVIEFPRRKGRGFLKKALRIKRGGNINWHNKVVFFDQGNRFPSRAHL
ncbi:hypothetical protein H5410_028269 [Solanum commersonii]|uniref:Uncharacterized protein n=1 Tax=Solanum commersonii TaxID=4109 RepID=A0A9J5Z1L1_SOLCO|nr:hypothetical protein H5410_028269 [Solanum commersonii]